MQIVSYENLEIVFMTESRLKLYIDKTEFLIIGTQRQRKKLEYFPYTFT